MATRPSSLGRVIGYPHALRVAVWWRSRSHEMFGTCSLRHNQFRAAAATEMSNKELAALTSSAMLGANDGGRDGPLRRAARRAGKAKAAHAEEKEVDSPLENEDKEKESQPLVEDEEEAPPPKKEKFVPEEPKVLAETVSGADIIKWAIATAYHIGGMAGDHLKTELESRRRVECVSGMGTLVGYEYREVLSNKNRLKYKTGSATLSVILDPDEAVAVATGKRRLTLKYEKIEDAKFTRGVVANCKLFEGFPKEYKDIK